MTDTAAKVLLLKTLLSLREDAMHSDNSAVPCPVCNVMQEIALFLGVPSEMVTDAECPTAVEDRAALAMATAAAKEPLIPAAQANAILDENLLPNVVSFEYKNYRGEVSTRTVVPIDLWHGATAWHPDEQWILLAYDMKKGATRNFALKDIISEVRA